ncbi:MAG: hypothetical protein A2Y64_07530 [Candidatus Coatesbacteria bacterium RBG_13_66_14]|uniref:DUF2225 domain-containing protein n=1 Tax=Candidatus Coatesbacteria bacterium RBG_13_66_14 TaxID=1817816 RepID=A0A1F5EY14_9BACT|nr:MAG: hypothetical protein A2Y64_07530 [Candidatus Coatesbacteria bacterium RBG_13_66_14]
MTRWILPLTLVLCLAAGATTLETQTRLCPVCGEEVEVGVLASTNNFGGVGTDFAQHAVGDQPWFYWLAYSPECGYADWVGRFGEEIPEGEAAFVRETLSDRAGEQPLWEQYYNLYLLEQFRGAARVELADTLLIGWWCLRPENIGEFYRHYYAYAIVVLLDGALEAGEVPPEQLVERVYLAAELSRLEGNHEGARGRFEEAMLMPDLAESGMHDFVVRQLLLCDAPEIRGRVAAGDFAGGGGIDDAEDAVTARGAWEFFANNVSDAVDRADAAMLVYFYGTRLGWTAEELTPWVGRFRENYAAELDRRPLLYDPDESGLLERLAGYER